EFCLDGELDLGARFQGMRPAAGERYPTRFCYIVEDGGDRVMFHGQGQSNPDMQGDWTVSFLPPDTVRIVNRLSPPDVEFAGKNIEEEASRYRRTDPRRLLAEIEAHPEWVTSRSDDAAFTIQFPGGPFAAHVSVVDGRLQEIRTLTDMPLRGRVPVVWQWRWPAADAPELTILVEEDIVFTAQGAWRILSTAETDALWQLSGDQEAINLPGDRWPAEIKLETQPIAAGAHLVTGVRTGFSHLVIETARGLIVADAPAGWVELQQFPPADLVPGYSISGLSENFIDYLDDQFPGTPIHAVVLTHAHDDHAAGARAFAAAGAKVYAPQSVAGFLGDALNHPAMPVDRLAKKSGRVDVIPVHDRFTLDDDANEVELLVLPGGPHVETAIGVWAKDAGVFFQSDLHVPRSDSDAPREDRAATECWFAEWAVANLPPETVVLNSHSSPRTPVSRLSKYVDSPICRGQ
ncbi:MAG: MBL fold metallo-hydrolase, partial [Woeseiaceae bacterium]